jgi:crotonobetainyl-CoA:carnitine CoA-transferase CaiB-like acyl-CoA transferase
VRQPHGAAPGALEGVRVLDFSRVLSGPHCSRMLADLGADVIKVEPPEGDLTRFALPRRASQSLYFVQQNVGKRNISLDLRRPEAVSLLLDLVPHVDVVLENFRPGVMARMGLGADEVLARNPRAIYAAISGYGQDGPWTGRRAYAPVVQAEMGMVQRVQEAHGGPPRTDPHSHADVYAGLECLAGILAALYVRERTGQGQVVDVSMAETVLSVSEHLQWELSGMEVDDGIPSFGTAGAPTLPTGDGRWVVVSGHPAARGTFELWAKAIGKPELGDDPRFATVTARVEHLEELLELLRAWSITFPDWVALDAALDAGGFAMGVVRPATEAASSEWAEARGAVVPVPDRAGGEIRVPNSPWHFSASASGVRGEPAYRGEHNREVFGDLLGLEAGELDRLEAEGVLVSRLPRRG